MTSDTKKVDNENRTKVSFCFAKEKYNLSVKILSLDT